MPPLGRHVTDKNVCATTKFHTASLRLPWATFCRPSGAREPL